MSTQTPIATTNSAELQAANFSMSEHAFQTHDDQQIFYRRWLPESCGQDCSKAKGAILLFHRGHEHGARMAHLVSELQLPDYAFYAWDARGHGQTKGPRGDAPSFSDLVRDVDTFVKHIGRESGFSEEQIVVVAQSVGAVIVSAWVHDYAPKIRAQILAAPAFSVKLYVPFAEQGLSLLQKIRGNFFVNSYVKAQFLTHDKQRIASYNNDPLITRPISVRILLGLSNTAKRIVDDAEAIVTPTQLLISDSDWVVRDGPQHEFFNKLGTNNKERVLLPGFYHDILGEKDRERAISKIRAFIARVFANPVERPNLLDADKHGFTRREADELATPLNPLSLNGLYWNATKASLKFGALLSKGVDLGQKTGFDSGKTLDYVYQNEARGLSPIGRLIDRTYLDAIGWRGIRQRKLNLQELIVNAMDRLSEAERDIHILDIAAGKGRYVLDAVEQSDKAIKSIQLRDYCANNQKAGQKLIQDRQLQDLATFEVGNAFSTDELSNLQQKPNIAIVSGLYELFSENERLRDSLQGLANSVPEGGYLIYTGQPWHPQLELIARALTSHRQGQAWIMRRRTQAELDQLVEAAGFRKVEQRIGPHGIFTVSMAQRITTTKNDNTQNGEA